MKPQLIGLLPGNLKLRSVAVIPETIAALVPATPNAALITSGSATPIYLESMTGDAAIFCKFIAPALIQPADRCWPDVEVGIRGGIDDTGAASIIDSGPHCSGRAAQDSIEAQ